MLADGMKIKNPKPPSVCGYRMSITTFREHSGEKVKIPPVEMVFHMHGRDFMTMYASCPLPRPLPKRESIYAIAWCISPPATLIYLCAAFIFWQFVSFDFITSSLLENSSNFIC
jgi:hypothetical protein